MVNEPPKSLTRLVYYNFNQKLITKYGTVQVVLRCSDESRKNFIKSTLLQDLTLRYA